MKPNNTIIILEDDHDDQQMLREALNEINKNYQLIFFDRAQELFNYLMSITTKPFIIISDINLPGMSGIELKRKIDSTDYLRKKAIPFVFLTTADAPNVVEQAYEVTNLQGYFKKQVSFKEMKQQVQSIIDYWSLALHPGQ